MRNHLSVPIPVMITLILVLLVPVAGSIAAEVKLAWDPHEWTHSNLIGYNLYYKAGSSVKANTDGSFMIYIPLSEPGFDPDHPSYKVTDLIDDTQYYFAVTAMVVDDDESGMSNEVSAINGASAIDTNGTSSSGSVGGGCFIDTLK